MIRAVVTDVEGTTSSLAVVKDVLFPYARRHLADFVAREHHRPEVRAALAETRELAGMSSGSDAETVAILERWMAEDRKATPLKALQGLVWEEGYRRGALRSHVYADVVPALQAFRARKLSLHVYSSGSVHAQHLFFEHTDHGDLRTLFEKHFDTVTGPKNDAASYRAIAREIGLDPAEILFLTDVRAELEAATAAGMRAVGVVREAKDFAAAASTLSPHPVVESFADVTFGEDGNVVVLDGRRIESMIALARRCHARGWALATSGNFSVRVDEKHAALTASGKDKGKLVPGDVAIVDLASRKAVSGPPPSAETALHCALYRRFGAVVAVAHTHSVAATVLSRRFVREGAIAIRGYEMQKALASVRSHEDTVTLPVVPNSQDMAVLVRAVDESLDRHPDCPAYLVAGHGLTTWAPDVTTLERYLEGLEFLLACELEASRHG